MPLLYNHINNMTNPLPKSIPLVMLVLFVSCSQAEESFNSSTTSEDIEENTTLVRTTSIIKGTASNTLEVTANVTSLDVVDVVPERSEPVVEILVEEGDYVSKGGVLARLRSEQASLAVENAEVQLQESKIALEQAKREYERDQKLVGDGQSTALLSTRDLEARAQAYETAKTAQTASEVALKTAKIELAQCTISAPITGTITARDCSLGDMTTLGNRMFEITDLSKPRVIMYRPQRELSSLSVGQTLLASSAALPGVTITGTIERIAPSINLETGTVKVTALLKPEKTLPSGILVRVLLTLDEHNDAILIDKRAIVYEGEDTYLFVIRDGKAFKEYFKVGYSTETHIEAIRTQTVVVGEEIVIVGADRLKHESLVTITNE